VLEMFFAESDASLSVREVTVREALSELFEITIVAVSEDASLDLESLVGRAAGVRTNTELALRLQNPRLWTGVCSSIEQVAAEPTGLSTYHLRIAPALWLLTQRRNYRIFQHQSVPEIVRAMLAEWNLESTWKIDASLYPKLEYRVQFGESDHAFVSRLLEEAGIGYALVSEGRATRIHFDDAPQAAERRGGPPVRFFDRPMGWRDAEYVNEVRIAHDVRPGVHLIRDYDFRNPAFPLYGQSATAQALPPEQARLEQYHYSPGAFLVETSQGSGTPTADDKGFARYLPAHGADLATRSLAQDRLGRRTVRFATNAPDLAPGVVFAISGHPQAELSEEHGLLIVESIFRWTEGNEPTLEARAVFAAEPWKPARVTPRPVVAGVQSATVVGPARHEIHVDEFGRVRVEFPWDRESRGDENSSCWIRVSQGWAGTGYGVLVLPRIGQEVLVGFLEGNPDQPVVVGRVFNAVQAVPYALPEHKTRSTWKSDSSLGSNGFNEILFEDLKGKELVYVQAEKNLRKLVKNDETITIGNDREKLVLRNELETTGADRTEVTRGQPQGDHLRRS
jgi:type VI secretion system secreted protein VgrG